MGMSLEEVQYKFASIIEALSKTPHTLSQFVIWLDLCVAEYKSNGVICLNCSGEKPCPPWLEGLKDDDQDTHTNPHLTAASESERQNLREVTCAEINSNDTGSVQAVVSAEQNKQTMTTFSKSISTEECSTDSCAETVSVTENRINGVFPIGWIKIPSNDKSGTVSESNNNNNTDEDFLQVIPSSEGNLQETVEIVQESDKNVVHLVQIPEQSTIQQGTCNIHTSTKSDQRTAPVVLTNLSAMSAVPTIKIESESCAADLYNNNTAEVPPGYVVLHIDETGEFSPSSKTRASTNWWAPTEMDRKHRRPAPYIPGPVKKARTNVGNMHRWLREEQNEFRHIEEIPPEELDPYLTKFLRLVRRKDGRDYDPNSFKDVRGSIERYLRDHGYSHSIVKSSLFYTSQRAYYNKKEELRHSLYLRNSGQDKALSILYY